MIMKNLIKNSVNLQIVFIILAAGVPAMVTFLIVGPMLCIPIGIKVLNIFMFTLVGILFFIRLMDRWSIQLFSRRIKVKMVLEFKDKENHIKWEYTKEVFFNFLPVQGMEYVPFSDLTGEIYLVRFHEKEVNNTPEEVIEVSVIFNSDYVNESEMEEVKETLLKIGWEDVYK